MTGIGGVAPIPHGPALARRVPRLRLPSNWSLARRYLLTNLVIVILGVFVVGAWVGHQIEQSVLSRTASVTALYLDSILTPHLQTLADDDRWLAAAESAALDRLISGTGLGQGVVVFKVWSLDGRVVYSSEQRLIGQEFPFEDSLARAIGGEVTAEMSDLSQPENIFEREWATRLVEVYAPIREDRGGRVIGVNEFYLLPDDLDAETRGAQLRTWAVIALTGALAHVVMAGVVKAGSDTIRRQQRELQQQVARLTDLLSQNAHLHERVRLAAGRTTALNERALRRISADLHDGPGQALGLALLRLDGLRCSTADHTSDFAVVGAALKDALADLRSIAAGLRLPDVGAMGLSSVAERAIADHEHLADSLVDRRIGPLPMAAPLEIKIALLRTLQESLSNATRHGGGRDLSVVRAETAAQSDRPFRECGINVG